MAACTGHLVWSCLVTHSLTACVPAKLRGPRGRGAGRRLNVAGVEGHVSRQRRMPWSRPDGGGIVPDVWFFV